MSIVCNGCHIEYPTKEGNFRLQKSKNNKSYYTKKCFVCVKKSYNKKRKEKYKLWQENIKDFTCNQCLITYPSWENYFSKSKYTKSGYRNFCISCRKNNLKPRVRLERKNKGVNKQCSSCGFIIIKEQASLYFSPDKQAIDKLKHTCKKCHAKDMRNRKHNITDEQYDFLSKSQKGLCAICKEKETVIKNGKLMPLAVDHCHKTNKIRGLLCTNCNTGIGSLKDSISMLQSAILYLTNHETTRNSF